MPTFKESLLLCSKMFNFINSHIHAESRTAAGGGEFIDLNEEKRGQGQDPFGKPTSTSSMIESTPLSLQKLRAV